jgi:diguanylate cyclase (GGDEF)-like protein
MRSWWFSIPRFADNPLVTGSESIGFYAGHPLRTQDGNRVGVLCAMDTKPREFSTEDMQALRDLAALAESELNSSTFMDTQKELLGQLDAERRRALNDPLTRLWNREGIMEILTREHAKAKLVGDRLGVLMVDIDFFKKINDEHGHVIGDAVIRDIAKRLLSSFREFDAIGRFGGEEFLIVMPTKQGNRSMEAIAARVCQRVSESGIATDAGVLPVTISIGGVDETVDDSVTPDDLIKRADDALYRAKEMGRNRTEIVAMDG